MAERYALDLLRVRPKERHEREARFVLAFVDVLREDTLGAEAALHRLIDASPGYPSPYILLARIQATSDRVEEARRTLEQATWAISQAIDEIDHELPTSPASAVPELESERRRLNVGLETVLRDYQALPP